VTFCVEMCDFTGSLPYIRGRLINSRYVFVWYKSIISVTNTEPAKWVATGWIARVHFVEGAWIPAFGVMSGLALEPAWPLVQGC
jgi:hypothetical protein